MIFIKFVKIIYYNLSSIQLIHAHILTLQFKFQVLHADYHKLITIENSVVKIIITGTRCNEIKQFVVE